MLQRVQSFALNLKQNKTKSKTKNEQKKKKEEEEEEKERKKETCFELWLLSDEGKDSQF